MRGRGVVGPLVRPLVRAYAGWSPAPPPLPVGTARAVGTPGAGAAVDATHTPPGIGRARAAGGPAPAAGHPRLRARRVRQRLDRHRPRRLQPARRRAAA